MIVTPIVRFGKSLVQATMLFPLVAISETYYVSPTGDDRNSGTSWDSAWQSPQKASNQLMPGDTVVFRRADTPYQGFEVRVSGTENAPITFRGEDPDSPPTFTGATQVTEWQKTDRPGVFQIRTAAKPHIVIEDDAPITKASSAKLSDGQWYWSEDSLYYRPTSKSPEKHSVWRQSRGGGIMLKNQSWVIIENLECWLGLGACITMDGGHHNVARNFTAQWHWRGVNIRNGASHNTIEDCAVMQNKEGIYISGGSSHNRVTRCRAYHNGNLPFWIKGDRAGIAIGETGINLGNTIEDCDIAFNGGPDSDPALIAYQAPFTIFRKNHVHENYGAGIYITIRSNSSIAEENIIENNGKPATASGHKGIAAFSIRRSHSVTAKGNIIRNNHVTPDSRWPGKDLGPKGGLDIRGLAADQMHDITLINNTVTGTIGGPNVYISRLPRLKNIRIEPSTLAPTWLHATHNY